MNTILKQAIEKLSSDFQNLNWSYFIQNVNGQDVRVQKWLGEENENIMVCVLKDLSVHEQFHRQDYYFINFAYKNSYLAKSYKFNNEIIINENDCYIGQPFSGYAIKTLTDNPPFIVGVLIKKEMFYKEFLTVISDEPDIFKFFINTRTNKFSDEFMHFGFDKKSVFKNILDLMIIEYANKKEDSQLLLKHYTAALILQIARRYNELHPVTENLRTSDKILTYIAEHSESVTLNDISIRFSYHPNYVSSLLKEETGKTFSQHLTDIRMNKALMLLQGTSLSIEKISDMLGYSNHSNFYKAFKAFYGKTPREYLT